MADLPDDTIGKIVTPVGYDGADFRVSHLDPQGDAQVDVLSSALPAGAATEARLVNVQTEVARHNILDRNPVDVGLRGSIRDVAHLATERARYTVPLDKKAFIGALYMELNIPAGVGYCYIYISVRGGRIFYYEVDNTIPPTARAKSLGCYLWLIPGDVVTVTTKNTTANNLWFTWAVDIIEFT